MRTLAAVLIAFAAFAAEDPWAKVKDLKSGTEIRVFKRGSTQPVAASFGELRDDDIVVIVKHEQSAIPKDQIDRLDARPQKGSRVTTTSQSTTRNPDARSSIPEPRQGAPMPSTSTSTSLSVGGKPDFETVYRRTPGKK